ncbi:MAG: hypothetical protein ACC633_02655 [Anaerolineales bacterium]
MANTRERIKERRRKKQQRNTLVTIIIVSLLLVSAGILIGKSALERKADMSLIEVSGQPSLKVDQELIDYGDVKFNTNKSFAIRLTNVGDEKLIISETPYIEVKEGC